MGVIVGVFLAIVGFKVVEYRDAQAAAIEVPAVEETKDTPLVLEFYEALKDYKVLPRGQRVGNDYNNEKLYLNTDVLGGSITAVSRRI